MMPALLPRLRLLLVALWAGSLWTVGYLVAPTLFATLSDRVLAGTIAGSMFRHQAWLSLVCGLSVVVLASRAPDLDARRRRTVRMLAFLMLACLLIGYFGLQPLMADIRQATVDGVMTEANRNRFAILHGVSAMLYLFQSVLAIALVIKNAPPVVSTTCATSVIPAKAGIHTTSNQ
jgi:MFS family permease